MKIRIIGICMIAAIALGAGWNVMESKSEVSLSDLALSNVEALAQQENSEKIFKYTVWHNDPCYVYVGSAYAKGKKVTCFNGNDHPVCVDCVL